MGYAIWTVPMVAAAFAAMAEGQFVMGSFFALSWAGVMWGGWLIDEGKV